MSMLINLMMGKLSQCIRISNHATAHFNILQFYVKYNPIEMKKNPKKHTHIQNKKPKTNKQPKMCVTTGFGLLGVIYLPLL